MIIQSKFKSVCPSCNQTIEAGSKVEWKQGKKAIHEQCHINQQEAIKTEWENKPFRVSDRIEVIEDIKQYDVFGNETGEMIPKGTKGEIRDRARFDKGLYIGEIVRKGQQPKTKGGFIARLDQIKITKKAKL